jgi:hypothetical protein
MVRRRIAVWHGNLYALFDVAAAAHFAFSGKGSSSLLRITATFLRSSRQCRVVSAHELDEGEDESAGTSVALRIVYVHTAPDYLL